MSTNENSFDYSAAEDVLEEEDDYCEPNYTKEEIIKGFTSAVESIREEYKLDVTINFFEPLGFVPYHPFFGPFGDYEDTIIRTIEDGLIIYQSFYGPIICEGKSFSTGLEFSPMTCFDSREVLDMLLDAARSKSDV